MEISGGALPTQKEVRKRHGAPRASSPAGTRGQRGPERGSPGVHGRHWAPGLTW